MRFRIMLTQLWWVIVAPFGVPVVPEVYMRAATASLLGMGTFGRVEGPDSAASSYGTTPSPLVPPTANTTDTLGISVRKVPNSDALVAPVTIKRASQSFAICTTSRGFNRVLS